MEYEEMLKKAKEELPNIHEEHERFILPSVKVETHGKTTIIKNFSIISKTLRRQPEHIAKYLFKTLGAKGSIGPETLLLNGIFDRRLVEKRVMDYIKDYVACAECDKHDTKIQTDGKITIIKCEACGARKTTNSV